MCLHLGELTCRHENRLFTYAIQSNTNGDKDVIQRQSSDWLQMWMVILHVI